MADSRKRTLTDSIGFWLLLFCGTGFLMLFLMGQKIENRLRQNALEGQARARQFAPADRDREKVEAANRSKVNSEERGARNRLNRTEPQESDKVSGNQSLIFVQIVLATGSVAGLFFLLRDRFQTANGS